MATESLQDSIPELAAIPNSDDKSGVETARILYDHVSKLIDEGDAASGRVITKVDKLLIVNTAMFAGIGYGMQNIDWTKTADNWRWVILTLAIVAGVVVLGAFLCGIGCLFLSERQVAGVQKIRERIKSRDFFNDSPLDVYIGLTSNLASSLVDNRRRKLRRRSRWLNRGTALGAVLVAFFLAAALGGSVLHKWSSHDAEPTRLTAE